MDKMLSLLQHRYLEQTYELEGLQARFEWISGVCDEDLLSALLSCMSDVGATDAQLRRHIKDQVCFFLNFFFFFFLTFHI